MKWGYLGNKETRKRLLNFFERRKESLIAWNAIRYFWGNDNGEWRFLSLSKNKELIGTVMKVSDSGVFKGERLVAQFDIYYVKNPKQISCSTLEKPIFRNFRKEMMNNGEGSYGKTWILYPSGKLAKLGDAIKLLKGSIKELPKEIKHPLCGIADKITLRRNGFYMPTLKGDFKIATKKNELYILKGNSYEKIELSEKNVAKINNEQLRGLFAICENRKKRGCSVDCDLEYVCRHRKEGAAKCLECGESIEDGELCYQFDCTHYFTPIFSHTYHWRNRQKAKCKICSSPVEVERIRGL